MFYQAKLVCVCVCVWMSGRRDSTHANCHEADSSRSVKESRVSLTFLPSFFFSSLPPCRVGLSDPLLRPSSPLCPLHSPPRGSGPMSLWPFQRSARDLWRDLWSRMNSDYLCLTWRQQIATPFLWNVSSPAGTFCVLAATFPLTHAAASQSIEIENLSGIKWIKTFFKVQCSMNK